MAQVFQRKRNLGKIPISENLNVPFVECLINQATEVHDWKAKKWRTLILFSKILKTLF